MNAESIPQWLCRHCGRTLDDHQQHGTDLRWHAPMCIPPEDIRNGIRYPSPRRERA